MPEIRRTSGLGRGPVEVGKEGGAVGGDFAEVGGEAARGECDRGDLRGLDMRVEATEKRRDPHLTGPLHFELGFEGDISGTRGKNLSPLIVFSSSRTGSPLVVSKKNCLSSPSNSALVRFPLPGGLVVADRYDISCRRVGREPASCSIVPERSLLTILVRDRWIHGPFCSGAGLADRIDLLRPGPPSLAVLRKQFYRPQPLSIQEAWSTALQIPVPALPSLRHPFLREQPSRPRDLLLRLFARALPTGARFRFMEDGGSCRRCQPRPLETLLHVFNECGPAASVSAALCRVARSHLGVTVPAPLVFFPLSHPAGQIAPWCLLVGAAAKTLWDERCAAVHQRESSSAISILHRVLGAFLSACKLFFWQRKLHHKSLGRLFEVTCLHIPLSDRTDFQGLLSLVEAEVLQEHEQSPNRPLFLVGESFGALLAAAVAARNPFLPISLVLINSGEHVFLCGPPPFSPTPSPHSSSLSI
ncbi:unnamed protein product [Closterium sp. NIES-65]|nr:unnamed protein product [Closterium sp. NIES-65]